MMDLDHQCVVQLLGVSHGPPVLMILELVPLGSLLSYLEDNADNVSTEFELPLWASQVTNHNTASRHVTSLLISDWLSRSPAV